MQNATVFSCCPRRDCMARNKAQVGPRHPSASVPRGPRPALYVPWSWRPVHTKRSSPARPSGWAPRSCWPRAEAAPHSGCWPGGSRRASAASSARPAASCSWPRPCRAGPTRKRLPPSARSATANVGARGLAEEIGSGDGRRLADDLRGRLDRIDQEYDAEAGRLRGVGASVADLAGNVRSLSMRVDVGPIV